MKIILRGARGENLFSKRVPLAQQFLTRLSIIFPKIPGGKTCPVKISERFFIFYLALYLLNNLRIASVLCITDFTLYLSTLLSKLGKKSYFGQAKFLFL